MEALVSISTSMQKSADNLTKLTESETLSPILNTKLERISSAQAKTENRLTEIEGALGTIMDWLNVPAPRAEAARNS